METNTNHIQPVTWVVAASDGQSFRFATHDAADWYKNHVGGIVVPNKADDLDEFSPVVVPIPGSAWNAVIRQDHVTGEWICSIRCGTEHIQPSHSDRMSVEDAWVNILTTAEALV